MDKIYSCYVFFCSFKQISCKFIQLYITSIYNKEHLLPYLQFINDRRAVFNKYLTKNLDDKIFSNGLCRLAQPRLFLGVEVGRERFKDMRVIVVEPCDFLGRHFLADDGRGVDGTERERLELQESAELGFLRSDREQDVFDAHAETTGEVEAGLVGDEHSLDEGRRLPLHPNLVRTFVNTEELAYAVTCSVKVVHPVAPHKLPCQRVELGAGGFVGENGARKRDVTAKNERIDVALLVGERTEGDGSGDVGGAVAVLRTAVEQQEAAIFHGNVGVGRRFVVDDGTVLLVGADGVERNPLKIRLFGAECSEFFGNR